MIEQEPKSTDHGVPPAYWPTSGELIVEDLSARYSPVRPLIVADRVHFGFIVHPGGPQSSPRYLIPCEIRRTHRHRCVRHCLSALNYINVSIVGRTGSGKVK